MTDTTASIAGKGCQGTGITEEIADRIADAESGSLICIVELSYSALHKKKGGKRKVELVIDHIEPATSSYADDYLREVQNAMYKNRALDGHVGTTTGGTEPTVEGVLASGERFKAHPFLPVNAGEHDQPICDVCGLLETAPIHSTQDVLPDGDDEPEPDEGDEGDEEAADERTETHAEQELVADPDPADEPTLDDNFPTGLPNHPYVTGCCDRPQTSRIHTPAERHLAPVPADPFTP